MSVGEIQPYSEGYMKASDLQKPDGTYGTFQLQIKDVTRDELKDRTTGQSQRKYVLWFSNAQKGMVLNTGNLDKMMEFFGRNGDAWIGHRIEVFAGDTTNGSGIPCKGLRFRSVAPVEPAPVMPTFQQPAQGSVAPVAAVAPPQTQQIGGVASPAPDDDIPF